MCGAVLGYGVVSIRRRIGEKSRNLHEMVTGSKEPFDDFIWNAPDTIFVLDADLTVLHALPAVQELLGYSPEWLVGRGISGYLNPVDLESFASGGRDTVVDFRMRRSDGSWRSLQASGDGLQDGPETGREETYRVHLPGSPEARETSPPRDPQDSTTSLLSRKQFMDRVEHALTRSTLHSRHRRNMAVMLLGIDTFDAVGASPSRAVGERTLSIVGMRLRSCFRAGDNLAHLGSGEFGVLFENDVEVRSAVRIAERLAESLKEPFLIDGQMLNVMAHVGIASGEADLKSSEDLIQAAASAVHEAKENGASYEIFEGHASEVDLARLRLEGDLWQAIERGELTLRYQPQVILETGEVVGVEALLRWEHPRRGTVSPEEFIAFIEETGLVISIGIWALREACRSSVRHRRNIGERPMLVGVNLSARQFQQPGLAEEISAVIKETGIEPETLVLEITESMLLEDTPHIAETLQKIESLGVKLSLDDFGTGYSSLSYLERIPVDYLKIDRSFVSRLDGVGEDAAVFLSAIVGAARTLGIETIAEGLETEGQVKRLKELRCEMGQGYYFSKPLPEEVAYGLAGRSLPVSSSEATPEDLE
jgi:diguanylate cyclase (GGDEF)-like protein/PAS domain S-box-containing protein